MKPTASRIFFLLPALALAGLGLWLYREGYLTLENFQAHRQALELFVRQHRATALGLYLFLFLCSALFLPGALALTLAGGMLFGPLTTIVSVNVGATVGALLGFAAARYALSDWVQRRFADQLGRFNQEVAQRGSHYLLFLRLLPVLPFFLVNYLAGVTRVRVATFLWTTSLGVLPGSVLYAFAGAQLGSVARAGELATGKILLALLLLALVALLPVLRHHFLPKR